jgi:hypothetical protein
MTHLVFRSGDHISPRGSISSLADLEISRRLNQTLASRFRATLGRRFRDLKRFGQLVAASKVSVQYDAEYWRCYELRV